MKRSAPLASRPKAQLTQKKIRLYLEKQSLAVYEQPRDTSVTAELRHAMYDAVKEQLAAFKQTEPLVCAFNAEHKNREYVASHYIRFFEELCGAFLKMFSSMQLPSTFDSKTGAFKEDNGPDQTFKKAWVTFHSKRANLRILCRGCHLLHTVPQYKQKETAVVPFSFSLVTKPQPELAHQWLDIKSWGTASNRGNYTRKLGNKPFTLFQRDGKWNYAYDNKFGKKEESRDTLKAILAETYSLFGDTIRRYL